MGKRSADGGLPGLKRFAAGPGDRAQRKLMSYVGPTRYSIFLRGKIGKAKRRHGPTSPKTLHYMELLGDHLSQQKQHGEAMGLLGQVVDQRREQLGPDHPDTARAEGHLA